MRIILCVTDDTVANLWKDNLKKTRYNRKIVKNEEALMAYLSSQKDSKSLICVEDIWVGSNFNDIKDFIISLKGLYPSLPIMVLSRYPNFASGKAILALGVNGYGNTKMLPIHFNDAIECIDRGDVWIYPEFVQMMIKNISHVDAKDDINREKLEMLSPREKEIAELIYQGYSNKEIASEADITLRTVKAHSAAIYEKMGVKDRIALVLVLKNRA